MSNRNPEDDHSSLPTVLRFALEQWTKGLHTAFPGMVLGFDPSTKRARIQPAIRILMTDGSEALRAPLADVPIIWPSAGGLALTFPIPQGASVMVLCSERGLTDFKRRFAEASPDPESVLDLKDAVAFAGFGALSITKAGVGATLQTEDGRAYIEVDHGMIRVKFGAQDIVI